MRRYDGHGYSFWYDEDGVYPVKKDTYNFALPACQVALQEALKVQSLYSTKYYRNKNRAGYVYVGTTRRYEDGVYKIGSSYDPETRYGADLKEILFTIQTPNRDAAFKLETELRHRYASKLVKYRKELFRLTAQDLADIRALATE